MLSEGITCDCSLDTYDYDASAIYFDKLVIARKSHVCCECKRTIQAGEQYENVRAMYETVWGTYKTCLGCYRLRQAFCPRGWLFGDLAYQIEECIGFNYLEDIGDDDEN